MENAKYVRCILIVALSILFISCVGGVGSIKGYRYSVHKSELENAVNNFLKNNALVYRDSFHYYTAIDSSRVLDTTDNNGRSTLTIKINDEGTVHEYSFVYYGDEAYWDTSDESEIFITYADHYSEGYHKPGRKLRKKLTNIFEKYFIDKIDSILGKKH